ncbi:MAG: hypothetical protein NT169_00040, partial [Chloroflexi bacterium]|nr:hypothetical protein [Chloroflexota bacterium]
MPDTLLAQFLVLALAGMAAATVAVLLQRLGVGVGTHKQILQSYLPGAAPAAAVKPDINIALGLAQTAAARWLPWGVAGGGLAVLLVWGLPLVPAIGGAALLYIMVGEFLKNQARAHRLAIEQELPTFVSRLGGMLLVTASPRTAV